MKKILLFSGILLILFGCTTKQSFELGSLASIKDSQGINLNSRMLQGTSGESITYYDLMIIADGKYYPIRLRTKMVEIVPSDSIYIEYNTVHYKGNARLESLSKSDRVKYVRNKIWCDDLFIIHIPVDSIRSYIKVN